MTVKGNIITSITPAGSSSLHSFWTSTIDLKNKIIFPTFADLHTHIDKGHTTERSRNPDGSLTGADRSTAADANFWDADDVLRRMEFSIESAYAHGTSALRTHLINMTAKQTELTWAAFSKLQAHWEGKMTIQGVSLVALSYFRDLEAAEQLADIVARHGGLLGAAVCCSENGGDPADDWTTCEKDRDVLLDRIFTLAKQRNLDLDFHVDENPNQKAKGLRYVAEKTIEFGYQGRVVCGHCCSLAYQSEDDLIKTLMLVRQAGITVVSLPLVNLWTQDRWTPAPLPEGVATKKKKRQNGITTNNNNQQQASSPLDITKTTPRWRGVTLLHEVAAFNIPTALASDNTRDQFYAYGDLDMLEVFGQSCRIAHLDRPYGDWPSAVTSVPADAMMKHKMKVGDKEGDEINNNNNMMMMACRLGVGGPADFVIFRGRTYSELLSRPQVDRVVVRNGRALTVRPPAYEQLDFVPFAIKTGQVAIVESADTHTDDGEQEEEEGTSAVGSCSHDSTTGGVKSKVGRPIAWDKYGRLLWHKKNGNGNGSNGNNIVGAPTNLLGSGSNNAGNGSYIGRIGALGGGAVLLGVCAVLLVGMREH
jgi:cytosine/creatinine deaminase